MLAKELSFQVDRRPYLLRPDRPPEGEPRRLFDGETETELNPEMQERARGVGLVMRRPQWSPNTLRAHEATVYAKEKGKDSQFHHLAAAAYWESGTDINDMDVLQGIVEAAGMDWGDLGPRIESGEFREAVMREYDAAKEKGVGGTPTYEIGGELHRGDVGIDELREAIRSAAAG
ncbi:MAG: DsbA family protein [Chloroflexi bacterium]|nr:DsbA family protein [Chloroflexota bacterium]